MGKSFSIIIPAYNESGTLGRVLDDLNAQFSGVQIVVVDDGSTDNTSEIAQKCQGDILLLKNDGNKGKGYSIRRGMMQASGEYILFTDADIPFGAVGIRKVYEELCKNNSDIVIAEKTIYRKSPFYLLLRFIAQKVVYLVFRLPYRDTQAGLKGFRSECAREILKSSRTNGFAIDIEILYLAKKRKCKVVALSLPLANKIERRGSFGITNGFSFFYDILKIRFSNYNKS